MSQNKRNLNAFVRYDGSGRVISGSLILQKNIPKDGNWKQTQAYLCCDPSCPILVYGVDFIITNIIEELEGITVIYDTAPGATIQTQLINCVTGKMQGTRYTIPAGTTGFEAFFSFADLVDSCGVGVRRECGPNYFSNWTYGLVG